MSEFSKTTEAGSGAVVGLSAVLSAAVVVCVGLAIAASNEESKELYGLDATTYLAYAGVGLLLVLALLGCLVAYNQMVRSKFIGKVMSDHRHGERGDHQDPRGRGEYAGW